MTWYNVLMEIQNKLFGNPQGEKGVTSLAISEILGVVLVVAVSGYFLFFYRYQVAQMPVPSPTPTPIACTQEAKLCSDGSAVGRTGPNCEFASCPGEADTSDWKTYRNDEYGFEFRYPGDLLLDRSEDGVYLSRLVLAKHAQEFYILITTIDQIEKSNSDCEKTVERERLSNSDGTMCQLFTPLSDRMEVWEKPTFPMALGAGPSYLSKRAVIRSGSVYLELRMKLILGSDAAYELKDIFTDDLLFKLIREEKLPTLFRDKTILFNQILSTFRFTK